MASLAATVVALLVTLTPSIKTRKELQGPFSIQLTSHRNRSDTEQTGLVSLFQMAGIEVAEGDPGVDLEGATDRRRQRPNIIWLHLHNFGGTFVCLEASHQGENTTAYPSNCNWPGDGCSTAPSQRVRCHDRASKSQGLTFSMLERDMDEEDFCTDALYGTMLRDPIEGLTSTLHQNLFKKSEVLAILSSRDASVPARHVPCLPAQDSYQHFDNFATRSLSKDGYWLPPRAITEVHLQEAKQRLAQMDVVLILEELSAHVHQLASVFGWDLSFFSVEQKQNARRPSPLSDWTAEELRFLRDVNKWDYQLYAYAQLLARGISGIALRAKEPNASAVLDAARTVTATL